MPGLSVNTWPTCIAWLNECNNCWWDGICISDLPKYMVIRWVPVSRSLEDNKYILSIITSQNTLLKIHKNSFWKRKCAVCHPKWMNEWTEHLSCHLKKNGRATIPFSEDDRTSLQRFAQRLGVYLQKKVCTVYCKGWIKACKRSRYCACKGVQLFRLCMCFSLRLCAVNVWIEECTFACKSQSVPVRPIFYLVTLYSSTVC